MANPRTTRSAHPFDDDMDRPVRVDKREPEAELDIRPSHLYDDADENLDRALRNLEARINQLYERLDPVMTPYDNGDQDRVDAELARTNQGRVINRIHNTADRLDGFAATLYTIHRRLVLPGDVD